MNSSYRWRLAFMAVVLFGVSAWFLYDGLVKWPRQQVVYREYAEIMEAYEHLPGEARRLWDERRADEGWPEEPVKVTDRQIFEQYIWAGITLPLGLLFGVAYLRTGRRWIASDEQGLHTSWGQHATWPALRRVDKTRWKTKGIAIVHYDDQGSEKRLTLDDWKYEPTPIAEMLREVEAHLGGSDDTASASAGDAAGEAGDPRPGDDPPATGDAPADRAGSPSA